ncbi:MAG: hypothetical protein JSS49_23275 [Planctomycetes bacterium]|nr:hypothetical protein [Planctomycetota bacterium]
MNEPTASTNDAPPDSPRRVREISGSLVVIGMLVLGVIAVSLLFVYFELHTGPFRPLREAIGREFRHSRPNVEGGRVKGRGPMILRISLSVPFDPVVEEQKATEINTRILEIARNYQDLPSFEQVQINLINFVPESTAKRRTFDFTGAGVPIVKPTNSTRPAESQMVPQPTLPASE